MGMESGQITPDDVSFRMSNLKIFVYAYMRYSRITWTQNFIKSYKFLLTKKIKNMKKLFFAFIITIMVVGCNQAAKQESTAPGNSDEMKALYEANLAACKSQIAAFEKEDLNAWTAELADNAVWKSPAFGDTVTSKAHWVESIKSLFNNFSNLHLTNAQFLSGVDTVSNHPDGSVRYYGIWNGTSTTGKQLSVKFYGTYDFNSDHKITSGNEFYDVGGMMNSLKP